MKSKNGRRSYEHAIIYMLLAILLLIPIALFVKVAQERSIANRPVDVLRNWHMTVDTTKTYTPGTPLTITSTFEKLLNVSGTASTYVQCKAATSNNWDGLIPVRASKATASPSVKATSSYSVAVPMLPNLPAQCRVYAAVSYNVNKFHPSFIESTYSNTFTVQAITPSSTDQSGDMTVIYTNNRSLNTQALNSQTPTPGSTAPVVIYQTPIVMTDPTSDESSPQSPPQANPSQTNNPGLVQQVLNTVKGIL